MTLVAILKGMFAFFESVPIIRDAFFSALESFYEAKIAKARKERLDAIKKLDDAITIEEYQTALGALVRATPK